MTVRLIHISDLHFGRTSPALVEGMIDRINALSPDLVAVSGDLTQRARARQFRAAMDMLGRIAAPRLIVPGNHDIPLFNLFLRLLAPWRQWHRHVGPDLAPTWQGAQLCVWGMNTADPFAHERGRIRPDELDRVVAALAQTDRSHLRVVVMHHPLRHAAGIEKEPMVGAEGAAEALVTAGADVVLCGHLHQWRAEPVTTRAGGRAAMFIQAGTGLSNRLRGERNDFNEIVFTGSTLTVIRHSATEDGHTFQPGEPVFFIRGDMGWSRQS